MLNFDASCADRNVQRDLKFMILRGRRVAWKSPQTRISFIRLLSHVSRKYSSAKDNLWLKAN